MLIGIIGAGNIGGTLTRRLAQLGHDVRVANSRGPETLRDLAEETGAQAVSAEDAARDAELVVVTIPEKAIPEFDGTLLEARAPGAPIVDTGNYYPGRDGRIEAIEAGTPESRWVSEELGEPVIKAFNNIYAQHLLTLGKPTGAPDRIALPVAGDDPRTKEIVMRLVDELGFDPVDAGSLDESWRQQPGSPCYLADLDAEGLKQALAAASPERPVEFRAAG
ncbi:MAG: NAD(P)-binding domain-containing protein [Solirubrobacterales bacterium]|nr:NAD(P)-binding domain-containing protein [Solirubrobacterales bacterium]